MCSVCVHSKADSITAADVTETGREDAGKKQWKKRQRKEGRQREPKAKMGNMVVRVRAK